MPRIKLDIGDILSFMIYSDKLKQQKAETQISPLKQHIDTYGLERAMQDYPVSDYADMWRNYESTYGAIPSKEIAIGQGVHKPSIFKSLLGMNQFEVPKVRSLTPPAATPTQLENQTVGQLTPEERSTAIKSKLGLILSPANEEKLAITQGFQQKMLDQREEYQTKMFDMKVKQLDDMYERKLVDIEARDKWKAGLTLQRDSEREANRKELEELKQRHRIELETFKGEQAIKPKDEEAIVSKLRDDTRAKVQALISPSLQWRTVTGPGGMMTQELATPKEDYIKLYSDTYRKIWKAQIKDYKRSKYLRADYPEEVPEIEFPETQTPEDSFLNWFINKKAASEGAQPVSPNAPKLPAPIPQIPQTRSGERFIIKETK